MRLPPREQLALVTRLVALASGVPLDYPVTLTAGELRVLLQSLASQATPRSRTKRESSKVACD